MKKPDKPSIGKLGFLFAIFIFITFVITMVIVSLIFYAIYKLGVLNSSEQPNFILPISVLSLFSITLGTIISIIVGRPPMHHINQFISALNSLARGNFETRIDVPKNKVTNELIDSFNTLASELQNTEMLRSDFVDNFSHEFKTPIVSIRGFAKLLKRPDLTEDQRMEYIDIIIDESTRLADLSTNMLFLAKLENQNILTDVKQVNISEQIRTCILLLERRWIDKDLYVSADFEEYCCPANEELIKQVWINILDNAIKYADTKGLVEVDIKEGANTLLVSIKNTGSQIDTDAQKRIFDKFYQGDTSRSSDGIGIGLAISKRIVNLHRGVIIAKNGPNQVVFTIELPLRLDSV